MSLKIGILSFAHLHAEAYIQNLRAIDGVEVIGLADDDEQRAEYFARLFGVHRFRTYEELLEARPEGVIICSENSRHLPLVKMAAEVGAHVLCEKPLATTVRDAEEIVRVCRQAGVLSMTAFPMRFSTPLLEVKNRLDAGELGQVYCFNSSNQGELPKKHRAWFVDKALAGGGAIMDHTVHLVDVMRWYLGSEVSEVYAVANRIFHADEVEVETGGVVWVTFENGVFATIDCSWSRPPYWPSWGGLSFEMVTSRGAVWVDAFRQNLTVFTHTLQRPYWAFWGSDPNQAMIEGFIQAIREQRPPRVSGEDGLRAVEVVEAAYQSVSSGQPVRLHRRLL
jgi:predicted dehydrogenase